MDYPVVMMSVDAEVLCRLQSTIRKEYLALEVYELVQLQSLEPSRARESDRVFVLIWHRQEEKKRVESFSVLMKVNRVVIWPKFDHFQETEIEEMPCPEIQLFA